MGKGGEELEVYLVVLDRLLRATTKNFFEDKSAPPCRQTPGYAYDHHYRRRHQHSSLVAKFNYLLLNDSSSMT